MTNIPPVPFVATVGYVRGLKIRSLMVYCEGKRQGGYRCDHQADLDLAPYPDEMSLETIKRRFVCTSCGAIGAVDARPNWSELTTSCIYPSRRN